MSTFVIVALLVWAGMNGYAFWRLGTILALMRVPIWATGITGVAAWLSFPVARSVRHNWPRMGGFLEVVSVNWLGILLLLCVCYMVVDAATLGGLLWRNGALKLRFGATIVAGILSGVAFVQGARDPVVRQEEIVLPGLPKMRDGLRVLFVSDMHLGRQIGREWLQRMVVQADALKPDLIAIAGDLVDHDVELVQPLVPELSRLQAPLGVWVVLGNHDIYGGALESTNLMRAAGFKVLLNESAEAAPGLRIAGVEDLGFHMRSGSAENDVRKALGGGRSGQEGVLYLSHTPALLDLAAESGAGLMLCGHTHGGQIWPFNYLVASRFPTIAGRYTVKGMTLFVSRGAGTWGPRMRLWKSGEIYLITLRAP
ncbi:MAG: metallophosphoesterase [Nibricoccus sp.]